MSDIRQNFNQRLMNLINEFWVSLNADAEFGHRKPFTYEFEPTLEQGGYPATKIQLKVGFSKDLD